MQENSRLGNSVEGKELLICLNVYPMSNNLSFISHHIPNVDFVELKR